MATKKKKKKKKIKKKKIKKIKSFLCVPLLIRVFIGRFKILDI
jgi:hypothetical protein